MNRLIIGLISLVSACLSVSSALGSNDSQHEVGAYLGARESVHPDWFKESFLDLEEDIAEATEQNKRLVLYFWQPGCPYCAELTQNNFAQRDIADRMQEQFDLVAINMWGDREVIQIGGKFFSEKTLAEALGVRYTPTIIFFTEEQKVSLRLDGYVPPERYRLAMDYVNRHLESQTSYRDFIATQTPVASSGKLHIESFTLKPPYNLTSATRPIAVYFEQKQCTQCDILHSKILSDPMTRQLAEQFDTVQLDMWSDQEVVKPDGNNITARQWASELGVSYAPSMLFFNTEGKEIMRIDSLLKTFHTQSVFDYVLSKSYLKEINFQRYISARAEHLREQGVDVDIWSY
ncbi:MAG: thioredoxin-related protein [Parasphingorhabdus sp.]|jgi:thioredoxin-related protein